MLVGPLEDELTVEKEKRFDICVSPFKGFLVLLIWAVLELFYTFNCGYSKAPRRKVKQFENE